MATPQLDGIDTSHYQGLTGTPLPPLTFAMHKASEGARGRDETLPQFLGRYRASSQVAHVGAYHWLRSDSPVDAQAENFLAAVGTAGGLQPGEFAVCDWERTKGLADPTPQAVERWCGLVGAEIGRHRVAVYSAPWVTGFATWWARNRAAALFLANYRTNRLLPWNGWSESARWAATAWQWSSTGRVPGIAGNCDMNHVWRPSWFAALNHSGRPPVIEEDDMATIIKVDDGDSALFAATGGVARWLRAEDIAPLQFTGQIPKADAVHVPRGFLANLVLAGPPPVYRDGYTGPRTTSADFAGGR